MLVIEDEYQINIFFNIMKHTYIFILQCSGEHAISSTLTQCGKRKLELFCCCSNNLIQNIFANIFCKRYITNSFTLYNSVTFSLFVCYNISYKIVYKTFSYFKDFRNT